MLNLYFINNCYANFDPLPLFPDMDLSEDIKEFEEGEGFYPGGKGWLTTVKGWIISIKNVVIAQTSNIGSIRIISTVVVDNVFGYIRLLFGDYVYSVIRTIAYLSIYILIIGFYAVMITIIIQVLLYVFRILKLVLIK